MLLKSCLRYNTTALLRSQLRAISIKNKLLIETGELETLMQEEPERLSIFHASYKTATFDP